MLDKGRSKKYDQIHPLTDLVKSSLYARFQINQIVLLTTQHNTFNFIQNRYVFRPFSLVIIGRLRHIKHKFVCQCFCELVVTSYMSMFLRARSYKLHVNVKRYKIQISKLKLSYFSCNIIVIQKCKFFLLVFFLSLLV